MGRVVDETGNHYGRLTVLYRNGSDKYKRALWRCRCDCGKEKDIAGVDLRNGRIISCGCYHKEQFRQMAHDRRKYNINPGDKIGSLTILEEIEMGKYKCLCDCGNEFITTGKILSVGDATTCGCRIGRRSPNFVDETGNRYGKLTVLQLAEINKDKHAIWKCRCDCGNFKNVLGISLRRGDTLSCGCLYSKGEQKINNLLTNHQIVFETQKTFNDLRSNKKALLFFDFYLPDFNILIEYQGIQHYQYTNTWWNTQEYYIDLQQRDNLKREYCQKNNIPLIEIPYTDYDKLDWEYLKEKCNL